MGTLTKFDLLLAGVLFCIALGASLFVADGRYGLETDGAMALHTAQNLVDGEGLVQKVIHKSSKVPHPRPVVTKPPLYNLVLALFIKMGLEPKVAGWSISQGSFAISAAFIYCLARIALPVFPAFVVAFLFCFQMRGLMWSTYAREEILFVSLTYASLLTMGLLRGRLERYRWPWVLLGIITACVVLTRYMGIALAATIAIVLLVEAYKDRKHLQNLLLYLTGLVATGLFPLVRFVSLWIQGVEPQFYKAADTDWFIAVAGPIAALQKDFTGTFVWFYDQSITDMVILTVSVVMLVVLLWVTSTRRTLVPISIYIACYLLILITCRVSSGIRLFEARYALPIEGLIILLVTAVFWQGLQHGRQTVRIVFITVSMAALVIFFNGQYHRFQTFHAFPNGTESSREICPSPETIAWIQENIPAGSVIMGTHTFRQLLAETNDYYWLPIPPTDEYSTSPGFRERWDEAAFIDAAHTTGARWVAILLSERGDPSVRWHANALAKGGNPVSYESRYGTFVADLLNGRGTDIIKQVAKFSDGIVYSIQVP